MSSLGHMLFKNVIKMEFLDGYRTYMAGASFVLGGVVVLLNMGVAMANGQEYDPAAVEKAIASISVGLGIVGGAGKADKLINGKDK